MKRPLWTAGITCLVSGLAAFLLPIPALPVCGLLLSAVAGVLFVLRKKLPAAGALLITVFTVAAVTLLCVLLFWQLRYAPAAAGAGSRQTITGRVVSVVEQGDGTAHFTLEVQEAETLGTGTLIRLSAPVEDLSAGDTLRATVTPRLSRDGLFPFSPYMASSGVFLYGSASQPQVTEGEKRPLDYLYAFQTAFRERFALLLPGERGGLAMATLFSDKSGLSAETEDAFTTVGVGHMFSVSGLHMTLLFSLVLAVLSPVAGRRPAAVAALLVTGLFLCMVGFLLSAVRAFVMLCVLTGADMVGRHNDSLNSLGLAVLLVVLWNPSAALDAGFLYSVSASAGVVGLGPPIRRAFLAWIHAKGRFLSGVLSSISVSLGAVLAMLPVSAMFGGTISPYTLLANLLIVPLSSVYVGCTLLAGLVGMLPLPFCFSLGKVLAVPVGLLGSAFTAVAKWLSALPFASFSLDYPIVRVLALGACGVLCLFFLFRERNRKRMRRAVAAALAAILLLLPVCGSWIPTEDVLLVSQRNQPPLLAMQSEGEWVVVASTLSEYPVRTLISALRQRGVTRLSALVLLSDTIRPEGQAERLLEAFPAGQVVTDSPAFANAQPVSAFTPVRFGEKTLSFVKGKQGILAEWTQGETRFCYLSSSPGELVRYFTKKDVIIGKEAAAWDGAALCIVSEGGDGQGDNLYQLTDGCPVSLTLRDGTPQLEGGNVYDLE